MHSLDTTGYLLQVEWRGGWMDGFEVQDNASLDGMEMDCLYKYSIRSTHWLLAWEIDD